jgi:hypothetical protein
VVGKQRDRDEDVITVSGSQWTRLDWPAGGIAPNRRYAIDFFNLFAPTHLVSPLSSVVPVMT